MNSCVDSLQVGDKVRVGLDSWGWWVVKNVGAREVRTYEIMDLADVKVGKPYKTRSESGASSIFYNTSFIREIIKKPK